MKCQLFQDSDGLWRWRLVAENGRIVAIPGEGFDSKGNAKRAFGVVVQDIAAAEMEEE